MSASPNNTAAPAYAGNDDIRPQNEKSGSLSSQEHEQPGQPRGTTGEATVGAYVSDSQKQAQAGLYPFKWSSLYKPAVVNPINGKSHTFNILRFWDPYATAFWLATLGFFVAFFGWFAAAALMTEAIKADLKLTTDQVANSNLASLGGTAIVRVFSGYFVDRYGPRKVMSALLTIGMIPTALMPTVSNIGGLETIRFFISILGGTFVPCQAWTTTFFDKNIIGTANAFSGGWGNLGGGVVPSVMIGLYDRLRDDGYTSHLAWRLCFVILPVPMIICTVAAIMILGKDHPTGKWSNRHQLAGTAYEVAHGREVHLDASEIREQERLRTQNAGELGSNEKMVTSKAPAKASDFSDVKDGQTYDLVDTAVSEPLTLKTAGKVLLDLRVWMIAISYMMSFGTETALDAALPQLIYALFASPTFSAADAAYVSSTYGLLNLFFRPLGGIIADLLYRKFKPMGYGLRAKVVFTLVCNVLQGLMLVGLGLYANSTSVSLGGVIGFLVAMAITGFMANAGAYSVYGHLRPQNIGFVAGLVGAGGNVGGLLMTAIFKTHPGTKPTRTLGNKFWIAGIFNIATILVFSWVPLGDAS